MNVLLDQLDRKEPVRDNYLRKLLNIGKAASLVCLFTTFNAVAEGSYAHVPEPVLPEVTQTKRITGTVVDENGEPVIGAAIMIKGTSVGTITNMEGKFSLDNLRRGAVIVISFVGLTTQEIAWNGQTALNIKLSSDTQDLDEVVVVAYGTAKKSSLTGSASIIKAEKLEKVMGTSFVESLQGMSAGVNVVNVQGNPGGEPRVEIRGIASMSGKAKPLYIVDGMPYDGNLNQITPSDIESMTVLKDAAATSLYGSRAANGVVMITTKKGKSGKPQITFRGAWGTSDNAVKNPKKANPYQQLENMWYALYYDAVYYDGLSPQAAGDYASANALSKQVKATTNSKGEAIYVTPFKYINEDYVLHDGNGNPYMNRSWNMPGKKATGIFTKPSTPINCARITAWMSADSLQTEKHLIFFPEAIWMTRDTVNASIINVTLSVQISVLKSLIGGKPVAVCLTHVIVRTFQMGPSVLRTLQRHYILPGYVMWIILIGFIQRNQERGCMTMVNISITSLVHKF